MHYRPKIARRRGADRLAFVASEIKLKAPSETRKARCVMAAPHEFITVGSRRWCLCCDLFESKPTSATWWINSSACPRNTPYAMQQPKQYDCVLIDGESWK